MLLRSIRKDSSEVQSAPGFVNRILIPMINEGIGILADGVADTRGVSTRRMKLGANPPYGTSRIRRDLIGLDVCLAIMETLYTEYGDPKYRPHVLLRKMVKPASSEEKTGIGFYDYAR